jgi:uncharacterized protein YbjT (DUF2867 family)
MQSIKVLILGASGSLAKVVTEELLKNERISLTLFLRNKRKLGRGPGENFRILEGDVMNYPVLKEAIHGHDIVYVNLAGNLEEMAGNIVKAMRDEDVNRIIAISSIGIYETPLRPVLVPYRKLADLIENSGLIYTILRPDWFTNGNEIDYTLTRKGEPESGTAISRKSIADFVSRLIDNPKLYCNENLGISRPM